MRVAIIGAGVAGLACAQRLMREGVELELFDKGRRVGGRLSTRRHDGRQFDHGAQFISVRDPGFAARMAQWVRDGVAAAWDPTIHRDGEVRYKKAFVGAGSNRRLATHLADGLLVRLQTRVAPILSSRLMSVEGESLGQFDHVVVTAPLAQAAELVGAFPHLVRELRRGSHAPCWALMLEFAAPFDAPAVFSAAPIAWAARESCKPGRPTGHRWIVHASPNWSREHLELSREDAAAALLEELGAHMSLPPVDFSVAHRWRYALVERALEMPCLHDPNAGITVAGDGFLGPRVEAAWLSGIAAATSVLSARV